MSLPVTWISREDARHMSASEGWWWPGFGGQTYDRMASRPKIVTLCGSTQFVEDFNRYRQFFTLQGVIVLSIEIVTTQAREEDPQHVNRHNKQMLDALHFEKIKISDAIFVINKGGYIGDSTRNEIAFAKQLGLPIEYMEPSFTGDHAIYVLPATTND